MKSSAPNFDYSLKTDDIQYASSNMEVVEHQPMDFTLADNDEDIFGSASSLPSAAPDVATTAAPAAAPAVAPATDSSMEMEVEDEDDYAMLFVSYRDGSIACLNWPDLTPLFVYPQIYLENSVLKPFDSGYQQGRSKYCVDVQVMQVGPVSIKEMQRFVLAVLFEILS